jgi:DNA-binding MarR family transcriptional regulator
VSDPLVQKIDELKLVGVQLFEILDQIAAPVAPVTGKGEYSDATLAQVAWRILEQRRLRAKHLPAELFSEPAWDMLLDLFVMQIEQKRVSVTSACLATSVPQTTALRWLDILRNLGLIERYPSSQDKRTTFIRLSEAGQGALRRHLAVVHEGSTMRGIVRVIEPAPEVRLDETG